MMISLIFLMIQRKSMLKSPSKGRFQRQLRSRLMKLVKLSEELHSELHSCSSVLLISQVLIQCISTHFNGSRDYLHHQLNNQCQALKQKSVQLISMTSSHLPYIETFADHFSRHISFYFHSCSAQKFSLELMKLICKSGDSSLLVQVVRLKKNQIPLIGWMTSNGSKPMSNSM